MIDGIVDEVAREPVEQHRVARHLSRTEVERYAQPELGDVGGACVERAPHRAGEVRRLVALDGPLGPRKHEQAVDQPLGALDGTAHDLGGGLELLPSRVRIVEGDVDLGADDGERRAQLVRGVGDELPLRLERDLQAIQHRVELVGEVLQLVRRAVEADALLEALVGDATRHVRDLMDGPQHPPRNEPAEADRDDGHQPQRDARLPHQLAKHVFLDLGDEVVEQRGGRHRAEDTGLVARRLPLDEERELASQLTRLEVQAVLQRLTQVLAAGREVAGNEREVEREQHRARQQKERPVPQREAQPDRGPLRDAEEPAHHGMR